MFTKTIKYTDYEGNERTRECRFHLSKVDLIEMNFSAAGGMEKVIKRIIDTQDMQKMLEIFKDLILKSYGELSDDGNQFVRVRNGRRLADDFAETAAYEALYMELVTDEKAATEFINGIIPQQLRNEMASRG